MKINKFKIQIRKIKLHMKGDGTKISQKKLLLNLQLNNNRTFYKRIRGLVEATIIYQLNSINKDKDQI
jgi:hypothetical protein